MKNDVVLINFVIRGVWGCAPPGKCLMFQPLRLFLVASEHSDGESLSVISTGSPLFQVISVTDINRATGIYSFHPASCRKYGHTHQLVDL